MGRWAPCCITSGFVKWTAIRKTVGSSPEVPVGPLESDARHLTLGLSDNVRLFGRLVHYGVLSALHLYPLDASNTSAPCNSPMPPGLARRLQKAKPRLSPSGLRPPFRDKETGLERGGDGLRPHSEGGRRDRGSGLWCSPPGPLPSASLPGCSPGCCSCLLAFPPD